jgi:hypothetical protein
MADLRVWEGLVKQCGGAVVAWINQAGAANLKAANSEGVCNAIFRDWLASYRGDQRARKCFVAKFAARDNEGNWLNANVPQDYLADQEKLNQELKLQRAGLALRAKRLAEADKRGNKDEIAKAIDELWTFKQHMTGGDACINLVAFTSLAETMASLAKIQRSGYIGLSLSLILPKRFWDFGTKTSGHMVGLEFQPAYNMFEYIDANLGLFAFVKQADMLSFIQNAVWPRFYQPYSIRLFSLYVYDVGRGGFDITDDELALKQQERDARRRELAQRFARMQQDLEASDNVADSDAPGPIGENEPKSEKESKSEEHEP